MNQKQTATTATKRRGVNAVLTAALLALLMTLAAFAASGIMPKSVSPAFAADAIEVSTEQQFVAAATELNGKTGTIKLTGSFTLATQVNFAAGSNVTITADKTADYASSTLTVTDTAGDSHFYITSTAVVTFENIKITGTTASYVFNNRNTSVLNITGCDIRTSAGAYLIYVRDTSVINVLDSYLHCTTRTFYGGAGTIHARGDSTISGPNGTVPYRATLVLYDNVTVIGTPRGNEDTQRIDLRNCKVAAAGVSSITLSKERIIAGNASDAVTNADAKIYYSIGVMSDPVANGTEFTSPIAISGLTVIKAVIKLGGFFTEVFTSTVGYEDGMELSGIEVNTGTANLLAKAGTAIRTTGLSVIGKTAGSDIPVSLSECTLSLTSIPAGQPEGFVDVTVTYNAKPALTASFQVYVYRDNTTLIQVRSQSELTEAVAFFSGKTGTIKVIKSLSMAPLTAAALGNCNLKITADKTADYNSSTVTVTSGVAFTMTGSAVLTLENLKFIGNYSSLAMIQDAVRLNIAGCDMSAGSSSYLFYINRGTTETASCVTDITDSVLFSTTRTFYGNNLGGLVHLRGNTSAVGTGDGSYVFYRGAFVLHDSVTYTGSTSGTTLTDLRNVKIDSAIMFGKLVLAKARVNPAVASDAVTNAACQIVYTTDGSDPTTSETAEMYTAPVDLEGQTFTVRAVLRRAAYFTGPVTVECSPENEIPVTGITIKQPDKITYLAGEEIDLTGLAVSAVAGGYTALLTDGEYSLSATSVPASQENGFMTITATYIYRGTPFTAAFRVYVYDESTTEMTVESADEFRGAALVLNGKTGTIKVGASFTVSDYTTEFRTGSNVTIEGLSPTSNYVITFSGGAVGNGGLVIGNGAVVTLKNLNIVGASAFAPIQRSDRYAYFSVEANARFVLINCDIRAVTSGSHYLTFIANGCTVDATDTTFTNNVRVFYGTGDGVGSNVYLRGNSKSTATSSYTLYRGTFILYDTASYSGNLAYNTIVDFRNTGISHSEDGEWVTLTKTGVTTSSLLFTTDGSDPTTSLTVRTYTAPFGIDRNTTVKAVLFIEGFYGDVVTYEIEYTGEIDDILEDILVLTSLPAKLVYAQGQTADFTGLAVAVKYTDGATAVLTAIDYDITGFSSATISENVTVTVWFGSDLKATFTISVKWATYFEDVVEGDRVTGLITALPATVTFADGTQIAAARTAYDALTTQQKGLVTSLDALTSAEAKWNVVNKINALPATIALSDKSNIVAARAAFDLLTETQQSQVANIAKLLTAESALAVLEQNASIDEAAAANVIGMINNLPAVIGLGDELAIMLARSSYTALTGTQKELVTNLAKLTTAETALADAKTAKAAADVVVGQIDALPAVVILTSETAIVAARSAYDGLSDAAKAYVTNLAKLTTAETALQSAKDAAATLAADRAAADTVIGLIDALPSTITNANAVAITAARTAYNGLTSARQALVTNLSKLTSAETAFGNIVKSIAITGNPSKTSYKTGETLDTTGLTVTFTRNNNTTAAVALSDCEITGFDSSTAGTKTITVKYQGFSQTFTVTVTEDDVKGCSTVSAGNPWIMGGGLFSLILMLALTTLVRRKRAVARAK